MVVAPGQGPIEVTGHWGPKEVSNAGSSNISLAQSNQSSGSSQQSYGAQQSASQGSSFSQSYIPEYSQTPILESIAKQAQAMAPEVYQWGMNQYNKNQGNIDAMMRNAMTYASPQRIASEMGKAEAGVQQGAEAGRQNAIKDLQSFGVDPSSGRYAALDQASRVMSGAAAAGAGNQQREATVGQGTAMQSAAQASSLQNEQTGYGAALGANALLGTASQLKYTPLGNVSGSSQSSQSSGVNTSSGSSFSNASSTNRSIGGSSQNRVVNWAEGGSIPQDNAPTGDDATVGGFVSNELSPSAGAKTDDVDARLNAGEFVIPKDVAAWKGQEFFYKLMAQARKMRATAGQESGQGMGYADGGNGEMETAPGYAGGGEIDFGYMKPDFNVRGTLDAGGPGYNSGGAGKPIAQATNDPNKSYRENTPPRMGWWGKEPGNPHEQTPDIRQYPELYGGTRGGWRPWENPGDIGYAGGAYTQPLDKQTGQPMLLSAGEGSGGGGGGGGGGRNPSNWSRPSQSAEELAQRLDTVGR